MSYFNKTNDGDEELIIFTIAKQFKQLASACKSKKKKSFDLHLYVKKTFENEYKSARRRKTRMVFSRLKFAWISLCSRWKKEKNAL